MGITHTVWLINDQRWNVRHRLLHRASNKSSPGRPGVAEQSQSTIPSGKPAAGPAGRENSGPPSLDEAYDDEPTFHFSVAPQRARNAPLAVTAAAQAQRHSSRVRCPRDFGPHVLY
jgi:hypothetical protein